MWIIIAYEKSQLVEIDAKHDPALGRPDEGDTQN
jgi:hypothetical protein